MYWEEQRVPALQGAEDVTDGDVDYYGTDWENVETGALDEAMQTCSSTPCTAKTGCPDNDPEQTDVQTYQIVSE